MVERKLYAIMLSGIRQDEVSRYPQNGGKASLGRSIRMWRSTLARRPVLVGHRYTVHRIQRKADKRGTHVVKVYLTWYWFRHAWLPYWKHPQFVVGRRIVRTVCTVRQVRPN